MAVVERKKGINKGLIILLVIAGFILAANYPAIQNSTNKFIVQKTKIESTVTKTITKDEIILLISKQNKLAKKYGEHRAWKTKWLSKEIFQGSDTIFSIHFSMVNHPKLPDSAKIKFSKTKYKVNGKTVEFISNFKIIQAHSKSGWEDYNN
jgi:hypothetical protein